MNSHASCISSNTGANPPLTPHSAKGLAAVANHTGKCRGRLRTSMVSDCGFAAPV